MIWPTTGEAKPGWSGETTDGQRTGEWVRRDSGDRILERVHYDAQGRRHGLRAVFGADGALCGKSTFTHGTGVLKTYSAGCGLQQEVPYRDGRQHGVGRAFDRHGRMAMEAGYRGGKRHGSAISWKRAPNLPTVVNTACFFEGRRLWRVKGNAVSEKRCDAAERAGIGATWSMLYQRNQGGYLISAVEPDGAAAQAGLQKDDVIETVDGRDVLGPQAEDIHSAISGKPGTLVRLRILRGGKQRREITIKRR